MIIDELLSTTKSLTEERTRSFGEVVNFLDGKEEINRVIDYLKEKIEIENEMYTLFNAISLEISGTDTALRTDSQRKTTDDNSMIIGNSNVFALYSLSIWVLGIATSIMAAEYLASSNWLEESVKASIY